MTSSPVFDLIVRMFAASIVIHDALYVCRDGFRHLSFGFLPVFGLRLGPAAKLSLHAALLLCCVALMVAPTFLVLYPILLALVSLKVASYALRLSNHMIMAWYVSLILTATIPISLYLGKDIYRYLFIDSVRYIVIILYFFAFFHKLNAEYLDIKKSCATAFVDFFCDDRGVKRPGLVTGHRYFGVYGTLVIEATLPILLFFEQTRPIGFMAAIIFHYVLGLMGIINFSMFMYTGLVAFLPAATLVGSVQLVAEARWAQALLAALAASLVAISIRWTPRRAAAHCPYRHRMPAWVIQIGFAILTAALLFVGGVWTATGAVAPLDWRDWPAPAQVALALIIAGFLANGFSPYLGTKTEFSFAMFSNLRIEPWTHLVVPGRWRLLRPSAYVEVKAIAGLPRPEAARGDKGAELALEVLSHPDRYLYSRYFFREGLLLLQRLLPPGGAISVQYVENGKARTLSCVDGDQLGPCLRMTRFPFVMPRNPDARHSEQGAILVAGRERQLF
ncbi:hypothetical protein [Caulobacter sp.]|uniref:hypothetical protein n=1 Tax=Caulobacter sp. TaxID=78 RepID=UPI002B45C3F1|nr:hypothetical protein [Caulobacter sp.]HJV43536.1 hypothetical protein [Caulobacter sp.]